MEMFIQSIVYLHIAAGMTALVVAPIAMIVKKGGRHHRLWGKVYFICMTVVAVSAVVISLYRPIPFLLMVAVFSYYFIVIGYRSLYLKSHKGQSAGILDWLIAAVTSVFNVGLIVWGTRLFMSENSNGFAYIAVVFGLLGLSTVVQNVWQFIKPPALKHNWLLQHMVGMIGGYIATVSAFSAVNFDFLPTVVRWLWPTVIGVPLLNLWVRSYKKKFEKGREARELVIIDEHGFANHST